MGPGELLRFRTGRRHHGRYCRPASDERRQVHVLFVRVGQGWIEFRTAGETHFYRQCELATAKAYQGTLTIKRHGARQGWFSSEGVFQFDYASIPNAVLFELLFRRLAAPG